jgi:DNA-directed RNA polymerase specialized sigma24 family protein
VRLATTHRKKLYTIAHKHLNHRYSSDIDDVVQEALSETWARRSGVQNTGGFIYTLVMYIASNWAVKGGRRYEMLTDSPEVHERAYGESPETTLLRQEAEAAQLTAWNGLRAKLECRHRKSLEDWEQRGYRDHNHAQESEQAGCERARKLTGRPFRYASIAPRKSRAARA